MLLGCVPEGEFRMGSNSNEASRKDEMPEHTVYLDAFWIDLTEVTNAMFAKFLNSMGNQMEGEVSWYSPRDSFSRIWQNQGVWTVLSRYGDHPVGMVSWYGAQAYCAWAGRRLPSEAQWEKAARSADKRTYPWGENVPCMSGRNTEFTNCDDLTDPVGSYPDGASPYGALDMAGNVWEWVNDWYGARYYYANLGAENPAGPLSGDTRVQRGGSSWSVFRTDEIRSANRSSSDPTSRGFTRGFRCAY
jgi:formylglycine-generating enzyme required for sulfatase activity